MYRYRGVLGLIVFVYIREYSVYNYNVCVCMYIYIYIVITSCIMYTHV